MNWYTLYLLSDKFVRPRMDSEYKVNYLGNFGGLISLILLASSQSQGQLWWVSSKNPSDEMVVMVRSTVDQFASSERPTSSVLLHCAQDNMNRNRWVPLNPPTHVAPACHTDNNHPPKHLVSLLGGGGGGWGGWAAP